MWQFLTIVVLFGLMAGFSYVPNPNEPAGLIAGTGFVLLAAFTMGEFFKRINLPALLGYIAAGIIFGPDLATMVLGPEQMELLPENITDPEQLAYVEILTVGVIGTLGGGELVLDELKGRIGTIFGVTAFIFLMIVPLTAGTVYAMGLYTPGLLPLPADAGSPELISAALLFGVFGFAMSPAATLAIIQEEKAKGPFTSMVLGVVIVADLLLVASYLLTAAFSEILISTGSLAMGPLMHELPVIGAEFMWALVIGVVTGVVFILYFRFVAQEMLFFTVGAIFVASYACDVLHAEKLLAFITAGFIVQNMSRHGHDMIEELERISLPVFVVYFTLKAANLDLMGMQEFIVLTLILTVVRTGAIWGGVKMATSTVADNLTDNQERFLWISFFSRGGVDLVLASLLASQSVTAGGPFPAWVADFQIVIMAVVVVHIVAGPPLLKLALQGVGETQGDEDQGTADEDLIESHDEDYGGREDFLKEPLAEPTAADPEMQEHLTGLRDRLTRLYRTHFVQPVRTYERGIEQVTERLDETMDEALAELRETLEQRLEADEKPDLMALAREIRAMHMRYRQTLQPQIEVVQQLESAPVTPEAVDAFLEDVRQMEDFDTHFRVDWEDSLLESSRSDGLAARLVKFGRRIRAGLAGRGARTVPVGRLWRYFVALALPEYLSGAVVTTSEQNEAYWYELGDHLREFDTIFSQTVETLALSANRDGDQGEQEAESEEGERPDVVAIPMSPSPDSLPYFSEMEIPEHLRDSPFVEALTEETDGPDGTEVAPQEEPLARCLERIDDYCGDYNDRVDFLNETSNRFRTRLLDRLAIAFEQTFDDFLDGVERAGTVQLPGFRYRPSSRFDRARGAEERLDERLRRESEVVSGYQGWIVADEHIVLFLHWFYDYRDRIAAVLEKHIRQQGIQRLRNLESRCSERPSADQQQAGEGEEGSGVDWPTWLDEQILPSLQRTRQAFNRSVFEISQGNATQQLMDLLETRVARFPESLRLMVELPEERLAQGEGIETEEIPLQQWFMAELIREAALRFVEFNEHAERSLRRGLVALEDIEQVLVFNLRTGQQQLEASDGAQADKMAHGGLHRASERLSELSESLLRDENELRHWIGREMGRITCVAAAPFLLNRIAEIPERLRKRASELEGREEQGLLGQLAEPFAYRYRQVRDRLAPVYREVREDLEAALTENEPPADHRTVRQRLLPEQSVARSSIPVIYRRLFTPIPIDIPDFYIPRDQLEQQCMNAVMEWFRGRSASILIHGDRGMGKRTLIHHLLPVQMLDRYADLDEEHVMTIRFGERVETDEQMCRTFSTLVDGEVRSMAHLTGQLRNRSKRRIVFIEDGHNLFARTPEGLERMRRFLRFASNTSNRVLWIVMLGTPAATFLDTTIDLFDYFTHRFEVEPLETDQIEQMITTRHRVSGFHLNFEPPENRLFDKLRHPIAASEASRHPRQAFFDRLGRLSGGNPMLALLYWLEAVEPDPEDDTLFNVSPLPKTEIDILPALSLHQQLLVAAIVRHRDVSVRHLAEIFRQSERELRTELEHLIRLGFIEMIPGREDSFRMRPLAEGLVTEELRRENLV